MRSKKVLAAMVSFLCVFLLFGCSQSGNAEIETADDEITLQINLDTQEDFGLLLIDYDANGSGGSGGVSNADKTLLKHDDQLFFTLSEYAFDDPSDVENLSIQFTIVTEYAEPNFEDIYPEEYKIPMDAISLNAAFGESYSITISGDKTNGYTAVLEE